MPAPSIYLDHNATTPIDPHVVAAMQRTWELWPANPASQHDAGRKARRMLEEAREGIASLLGAKTTGMDADQLLFTSGGTEANNLAVLGLANTAAQSQNCGGIAFSAVEHPSITTAAMELGRRGFIWGSLKVNADGVVDLKHFGKVTAFNTTIHKAPPDNDTSTEKPPSLVSVMLANNETGIVQPVVEIASFFRERGALIHTDAVQAIGKIPVHFRDLGVDAMTVAPHKFHGPLGIGALILRHGIKLQPQLFGGFQQSGLRPGTENVALAVGFFEALRLSHDEAESRQLKMKSLHNELERLLRQDLPDIVIIGEHSPRLPNTSCIAFPGLNRQALAMALDMAGVACSTGSACASGSSEPSPTLIAMGLSKPVIESALRFSLGAFTTAKDVAEAACRIINCVKHLRAGK